MPRKRYSVEQIVNHLREADVWLAQGRSVGEVCRLTGLRPMQMSSSLPCISMANAVYNLIREGRGVPAVPLVLVGVAP
jgi:hypothetical protein